MNKELQSFIELVRQYPDLPVYPIVDGEVCPEASGYWQGSFGFSELTEFCLFPVDGDLRFSTRDNQGDIEELLANELEFEEEYINLSDKEFNEAMHEKAESLAWEKAIVLYISPIDYKHSITKVNSKE